MVAALPLFNNRIAPVFDEAGTFLRVRIEGGRIVERTTHDLPRQLSTDKIDMLSEMGTTQLICGAISRAAEALVAARDIEVHAFVAGDIEDVLRGWLEGRLAESAFRMPGCGMRGRRNRGRCGRGYGRGRGLGRGRGRGERNSDE